MELTDFFVGAVISGIAWDTIKTQGKLSIEYYKNSLKDFLKRNKQDDVILSKITDEQLKTIVSIVNNVSNDIKNDKDLLALYLKKNDKLKEIISSLEQDSSVRNIQQGNDMRNSININNYSGNGDITYSKK
jgi:hypothetical protein